LPKPTASASPSRRALLLSFRYDGVDRIYIGLFRCRRHSHTTPRLISKSCKRPSQTFFCFSEARRPYILDIAHLAHIDTHAQLYDLQLLRYTRILTN
jgi:hypothetical protein